MRPDTAKAQTTAADTSKATQQDTSVARKNTAGLTPCEELSVYPNPATTELNVVYGPGTSVRNIAIYNLIGKVMNVYKAGDAGSANLNLDGIPEGIYYVWLMNPKGDVIATKKFTKQ